MAIIPEKYLDLLQKKKAFASVATVMADGSPQVTPVWFDYKDGIVRVNTAKGRVKAHTLREGAPVALAIIDPDPTHVVVALANDREAVVVRQICADGDVHGPEDRARSAAALVSVALCRRPHHGGSNQ